MYKKFLPFILFVLFFQITRAQNEFITVWKPTNISSIPSIAIPYGSNGQQLWFPGKGTNYTLYWEEVGYPIHHATMTNVSSNYNVLIDFGAPLNPNPYEATYRIKISNGNGNFHQIQFIDADQAITTLRATGDELKIVNIEQWGNIKWSSMLHAFSSCQNLDITATDSPDLTEVTDMAYMFFACFNLIGNPTINNWDISNVNSLAGTFNACLLFNQPIGNWNTSNVTSMIATFLMAEKFNQPLNNWNTSKVTNTSLMFANALEFNQPIGNWNMSNNLEMNSMFFAAENFNQPIGNWDTSKVITTADMFYRALKFNQPIGNWNTSKVTTTTNMFGYASEFNQPIGNWDMSNNLDMSYMFNNAVSFNQSLGNWQLNSLQRADHILKNTALNCQNYDKTLYSWSQNQSIANDINMSAVSPLVYSSPQAVTARDYLLNSKGWTITGDTYDQACNAELGTSDIKTDNKISISPNPATDIIYIKNTNADRYTIFDLSGRIILKGNLTNKQVGIQSLIPGNYILQLQLKDSLQNIKFIKK
jgi:surface protein